MFSSLKESWCNVLVVIFFFSYKINIQKVSEPFISPRYTGNFRTKTQFSTNLLHILHIYKQTTVACNVNYLRWAESCAVRCSSPNIEMGLNIALASLKYEYVLLHLSSSHSREYLYKLQDVISLHAACLGDPLGDNITSHRMCVGRMK